jgi:hypothetical protein
MPLQKLRILAICLPSHVGYIANEWNAAQKKIHADVSEHTSKEQR